MIVPLILLGAPIMSHVIELPDDVYNALEEAAANCGTTPAKWLADQLQQPALVTTTAAGTPSKSPCEIDCDDVFWRETGTPRPR
jgi:hypothetical protein